MESLHKEEPQDDKRDEDDSNVAEEEEEEEVEEEEDEAKEQALKENMTSNVTISLLRKRSKRSCSWQSARPRTHMKAYTITTA